MKKILATFLILSTFLSCVFAKEVCKIAYIGNSTMPSANVAIYNGVRDALNELQSRYGKKFELEFVSEFSVENQIKKIGNVYIDGYSGAVVFPISTDTKLTSAMRALTEKSFPVVLVGRDLKESKRLLYVGGDEKKFYEMLSEQLKILAGKDSLHLYIYGNSNSFLADSTERANAKEKLFQVAKTNFNEVLLNTISDKKITLELIELYSLFTMANKISIMRRDNYGEIFMSPELLADMTPINRDTDRRFAICVGGAPYLSEYLQSGQLSACVYNDFYGWGYFSARAIAERIVESILPSADIRLIKPLVATPENADSFKSDWKKWTK